MSRMRKWAIGAAAVWITGSLLLYGNLRHGYEASREIDELLAQGMKELEPCRQFREKMKAISREDFHADSPSHPTRSEALAALALLEAYPGSPPSHRKALQIFHENWETFNKRYYQAQLVTKWVSLEAECDVFAAYLHGQLLLKDAKVFRFSPSEQARMQKAFSSYLKSEQPSYVLIPGLIRISLLHELLKSRNRPGDQALVARTMEFMEQMEKKREAVSEAWKNAGRWSLYRLSWYTPERNAAREMSEGYARLLADAKL